MPSDMLAYYDYPKRPIEPNVAIKAQKKRYDILQIEFPSALNVFGNENSKIDSYVGMHKRAAWPQEKQPCTSCC